VVRSVNRPNRRLNVKGKKTPHVDRHNFAHHSRDRTSRRIQWDRRRALLWHGLLWRRRAWAHTGCALDPGFNGQALGRRDRETPGRGKKDWHGPLSRDVRSQFVSPRESRKVAARRVNATLPWNPRCRGPLSVVRGVYPAVRKSHPGGGFPCSKAPPGRNYYFAPLPGQHGSLRAALLT
jgi:hypothetical protein